MKRAALITLSLLVFIAVIAWSGESLSQANKYVQFAAKAKEDKLAPGKTGQLLISLTPVKGIHVNLTPPMSLKLDNNALVSAKGTLGITKGKNPDYLDHSSPISQQFTLSPKAKPGSKIAVKGTLTYFYCSDAEGWCSKFQQPVEVQLSVAGK